jgi:hypothetical protein
MAFVRANADLTKRYLVQEDYYGGPHNHTNWTYYTEDTIATVDGSGYFSDEEAISELKVGHRIWVYVCANKDDLNAGIIDAAVMIVVQNTGTFVDLSVRLLSAAVTYGD